MFTVFIVIIAIIAVLLILLVLVQNSKGGGLAGEFGGSGATQMFGVKRTTDLLEQITWGLAGAMATLALVSNLFIGTPSADSGINSVKIKKANSRSLPAAPAPTTPAPSTTPAPAQQQPAPAQK